MKVAISTEIKVVKPSDFEYRLKIFNLIRKGLTYTEVIAELHIGHNTFNRIMKGYVKVNRIELSLGFKDESYYSEAELIRGYVAPTYKQLSEDEKLIFDNLN